MLSFFPSETYKSCRSRVLIRDTLLYLSLSVHSGSLKSDLYNLTHSFTIFTALKELTFKSH